MENSVDMKTSILPLIFNKKASLCLRVLHYKSSSNRTTNPRSRDYIGRMAEKGHWAKAESATRLHYYFSLSYDYLLKSWH